MSVGVISSLIHSLLGREPEIERERPSLHSLLINLVNDSVSADFNSDYPYTHANIFI